MSRLTGRALRGAAVAAALVCAYAAGVATGGSAAPVRPRAAERPPADAVARAAAPGGLPRGAADRAAINAMLSRLGDRWARFYSAPQFAGLQDGLNGFYDGVGLWLEQIGAQVRVAAVAPGSPAARAGVRAGDVISAVGGVPARELTAGTVAAALRGRPSTSVALDVRRDGVPLRFPLVRAALATHDVDVSAVPGGVLLIRVAAFTRGVGHAVRNAVAGRYAHRGGILLDLRGDPGGLLDEAVATASAFLRGGPVLTFERTGARPERLYAAPGGDAVTPLVVLVDGGTASAAEAVAGSLRDRDRAVIVGSRTFGKGSVQEPLRLADGSAIELTVGRYRTPSGRSLEGAGIDPDVAVDENRPPREAERRALSVLRGLTATLPTKDRG